MKLLAMYLTLMVIGYILGSRLRHVPQKFSFLNSAMTFFIVLLVFIMGLQMGADEEVTSSLGSIGLQSLLVTLLAVGGSILFVIIGRKIFRLDRHGLPADAEAASCTSAKSPSSGAVAESGAPAEFGSTDKPDNRKDLMMTLLILLFVAAGMLIGYFLIPKLFFGRMDVFDTLSGNGLVAGLSIMLTIIGFNMGLSGEMEEHLKGIGLSVLVIPVLAIAGSLAGGAVYGVISGLSVREGIAISAGFGWYTLAPGLITEAGYTVAGAISFMHNVMRETLGIIGIPMFARYIGYLEAAAVPGVAAMDVCLPIVQRSTRPEIIVYSFMTGLLMCLIVPVIVPLMVG